MFHELCYDAERSLVDTDTTKSHDIRVLKLTEKEKR